MCGRYTMGKPGDALTGLGEVDASLVEQYQEALSPDAELRDQVLAPRYNIAPTQTVLSVRPVETGLLEAAPMRWGLVPWFSKAIAGRPLINARAETVATKPSFRQAFAKRRCLLPADGFYEWGPSDFQPSGGDAKKNRVPHHFCFTDGEPFWFAGVWDRWRAPTEEGAAPGEPIESCALITTSANELVEGLHDRMPVMLGAERALRYLSAELSNQELERLLVPADPSSMEVWPVEMLVNKVANEGPQLIVPAQPPEPGPQNLSLF